MIQQTSIAAFENLDMFDLGHRQRVIYEAFRKKGACTNLEISTWEKIPINQVTPRTNELVKLGFLVISHKRQCTISKRVAIAWRVNNG